VEEPAVEEPAAEEPLVEEPAVEEPTVEEPAAEESAVEAPTTEAPTTPGAVVDGSPSEGPAAETPSGSGGPSPRAVDGPGVESSAETTDESRERNPHDWWPSWLDGAIDTFESTLGSFVGWFRDNGDDVERIAEDVAGGIDTAAGVWGEHNDEVRQAFEFLHEFLDEQGDDLPPSIAQVLRWFDENAESHIGFIDGTFDNWAENRDSLLGSIDWVEEHLGEIEQFGMDLVGIGRWLGDHHPHAERAHVNTCGGGIGGFFCDIGHNVSVAWDWSGADSLWADPSLIVDGFGWLIGADFSDGIQVSDIWHREEGRCENGGFWCNVYDISGLDSVVDGFASLGVEPDPAYDWVPDWVGPGLEHSKEFVDGKGAWVAEHGPEILETTVAVLDALAEQWEAHEAEIRQYHGELHELLTGDRADEIPAEIREVLMWLDENGAEQIENVDAAVTYWRENREQVIETGEMVIENAETIEKYIEQGLDVAIWLEEHHPHAEKDCGGNRLCEVFDWTGIDSVWRNHGPKLERPSGGFVSDVYDVSGADTVVEGAKGLWNSVFG
jgi:hypothetical protein